MIDLNVNLHIFKKGDRQVKLNLLFLDYLRAHPSARDKYAALKYQLLEDQASHKKAYSHQRMILVLT